MFKCWNWEFWTYFFTEINVFVITQRVKYRKKVPLGTGTEFQVPIPVLVPVQTWTVPNPICDRSEHTCEMILGHVTPVVSVSVCNIKQYY